MYQNALVDISWVILPFWPLEEIPYVWNNIDA